MLHNKFIVIRERNGVKEHIATAENVVCNATYDNYTKMNNTYSNLFSVGTDRSEPSPTDNGVKKQVLNIDVPRYKGSIKSDLAYPISTLSYTWYISDTQANGQALAEIGQRAYNNALVTRALFKDAEGNPIVINKTNLDKLYIECIWYEVAFEKKDNPRLYDECTDDPRLLLMPTGMQSYYTPSLWANRADPGSSRNVERPDVWSIIGCINPLFFGTIFEFMFQNYARYARSAQNNKSVNIPAGSNNGECLNRIFGNFSGGSSTKFYYQSVVLPKALPDVTFTDINLGTGDGVKKTFKMPNMHVPENPIIRINKVQTPVSINKKDHYPIYHNNIGPLPTTTPSNSFPLYIMNNYIRGMQDDKIVEFYTGDTKPTFTCDPELRDITFKEKKWLIPGKSYIENRKLFVINSTGDFVDTGYTTLNEYFIYCMVSSDNKYFIIRSASLPNGRDYVDTNMQALRIDESYKAVIYKSRDGSLQLRASYMLRTVDIIPIEDVNMGTSQSYKHFMINMHTGAFSEPSDYGTTISAPDGWTIRPKSDDAYTIEVLYNGVVKYSRRESGGTAYASMWYDKENNLLHINASYWDATLVLSDDKTDCYAYGDICARVVTICNEKYLLGSSIRDPRITITKMTPKYLEVTFDTPPPLGAVVTADYSLPYLPKDENIAYSATYDWDMKFR